MEKSVVINGQSIDWGVKTYIMGILNLTPDSFSGDGLLRHDPSSEKFHLDLEQIS